MLKPIASFVDYAINYDYISKVLCINKDKPEMHCNGQCYVMKELQKQKDKDYAALEIHMEEYPIGFVSFLQLKKINYLKTEKEQLFYYKKQYSFLFKHDIFHPPIS